MFYVSTAFESKSQFESIIDIVEIDFKNSKQAGLMIWLAKPERKR
jgi:hypothetical protein